MLTFVRPLILVGLVFLCTSRGEDSIVCVWGERCVLPCTFPFGNDTLIHWVQNPKKMIHSYYDNRDQLQKQVPGFRDRTSLFHDEIPRGNASLLLMGVKVEDQGGYLCYTSTASDSSEKHVGLQVEAPVREVKVVQVNDRITCSSERIYPEPTLSWSTSPQEAHDPEVQVTEDRLYKISSTIVVDSSANVSYSCTVSAGGNKRTTTLFPSRHINTSDDETTIFCPRFNTEVMQLTWRFNHNQIILTRTGTGGGYTPSHSWRQHVKDVSQSGDLQLQQLTSSQQGTFTCELSGDQETYVTVTKLTRTEPPPKGGAGGLTTGEIAGVAAAIVVVVVVVVAVLIGAALTYYCKRRKTKEKNAQDKRQAEPLRDLGSNERNDRSSSPDGETKTFDSEHLRSNGHEETAVASPPR